MNKNVTDSWKSKKLNACADSVDQALFSAPSKEPGYEASCSSAGYHINTSSLLTVHSFLVVVDRLALLCCSPDCWCTQNSSVHWPGRIYSSDRWCTQDSPVRWHRETLLFARLITGQDTGLACSLVQRDTIRSSDHWYTQDSPVRWYRETLFFARLITGTQDSPVRW